MRLDIFYLGVFELHAFGYPVFMRFIALDYSSESFFQKTILENFYFRLKNQFHAFMNFNFRPAKLSEVLQISLVLKQVYLETYGTEGVSKLFAEFITKQFSVEKITEEMHSDKHDFRVATCNENPIGVLKIDYNKSCPEFDLIAPEINKIYIMRRFFKKGIGSRLMAEAEKSLKEKGHKKLWLQVWAKNDGAIEFYKKLDWKVLGEVWFWIEENKYPNFVLTKNL